jgi:hypothetical protein
LLVRVPYFWEDDFEMENPNPCWQLKHLLASGNGMKVLDFHPIHVYLNSVNMQNYRALKQNVSNLIEATPSDTELYVHQEQGTQTLFTEIVEYLTNTKSSICIRDIVKIWQNIR